MSTLPSPAHARAPTRARTARLADYEALCKPGLCALVVATTALGYMLAITAQAPIASWGFRQVFDLRVFFATIAGTTLLAFAAGALNQCMEARWDVLMERTRDRPLPAGRLSRTRVAVFGGTLAAGGVALLFLLVNPLTAGLGLFSLANYLLVYTPLKRHTTLNTIAGAVTGGIPPMMGWTAATGEIGTGAWVLFAILFLWQIPHFLSIAWMYREDYRRAGFKMLTVADARGDATAAEMILYSLALLPASFLAVVVGLSGWIYLIGAAIFGSGMLALAVRFYRRRSDEAARQLFLASLVYLPLLFCLMALDPTTISGGFIN